MKKQKQVVKTIPAAFDFWKDNLKSGYFSLTQEELKTKFRAFIKAKEKTWIEYYGSGQSAMAFIREDLHSVFNEEDREALMDLLWPVYMEFL